MAEAPEEVLVDVEAQDNASPTFTSVGRSISVLGSTLGIVTRDLGIHNAALNEVIKGIDVLGASVRAIGAVQKLYSLALEATTVAEGVDTEVGTADAAMKLASIGPTEALTESNYGLAASFAAIDAAMGPVGWAMLAAGLIGAGALGYGLGGGFGGGGAGTASPGLGTALANPTLQVNIANADFSSHRSAKKVVNDTMNYWYQQMRGYTH